MKTASLIVVGLFVGLFIGTYGGFVWGSDFGASLLSELVRNDREAAAKRAVANWFTTQPGLQDQVLIEGATARGCMMVTGQFASADEDGRESRRRGLWFVTDTTVIAVPAALPPAAKLPENAATLPAAELLEMLQTLQRENDLLREVNASLRQDYDPTRLVSPSSKG